MRLRLLAGFVALAFASGACDSAVTSPSPSSHPASPTAGASDPAEALLIGPWRPAPVDVDPNLLDAAAFVCRNPEEPRLKAALENVPVAMADARGESLLSLILADDNVAFECRLKLESIGGVLGATILEPPSRLAPDAVVPLDEAGIKVVSHTRVDEETGSRTILIGRIGPKAFRAAVGFNDESEVRASKGNGWYMAWWPGAKDPGAIVSLDSKSIVVAGAASPATQIEGRVGPAAWWIDPAAPPLAADATVVRALIREQACASGGAPEGRVLDPVIFFSEAAVLVTIWVRRAQGAGDCQANPAFPIEIMLPDALGARKLLDGSTLPPRDASVAPE